jgi:twitching motility protein PilT
VILVGEMRDLETTSAAITAAETGHLVFSTLHTVNAPQTIERIIDIYPSDEQNQIRSMLANTLQAVISQTLFKRATSRA